MKTQITILLMILAAFAAQAAPSSLPPALPGAFAIATVSFILVAHESAWMKLPLLLAAILLFLAVIVLESRAALIAAIAGAAYFKAHPDSPFIMVAGNAAFPFNDLVRVAVERGLPAALALVALLVVMALRGKGPAGDARNKHSGFRHSRRSV